MTETRTFSNVERFCIFAGEPRSGHSVVGTLINSHRNAVISHNLDVLDLFSNNAGRGEIFRRILERDRWLAARERRIGGYSYDVSGGWLGYHEEIRVIGDKRAGATSRSLSDNPALLQEFQRAIGFPVCAIHHVRNPWDNICSIWRRRTLGIERTLSEAADYYFYMLDGCVRGLAASGKGVTTLRTYHEELIRDPEPTLRRVFESLSLPVDHRFLEVCRSFVHRSTRDTRHSVTWPSSLIRDIGVRLKKYDFLKRYEFD